MEVRESGVQGKEFLSPSLPFKPELTAFLPPGRSMGLLDQIIATSCGHNLNVLHTVEHREFPQGRPVAPQLIGMNDLWHVVFPEQADEERFGSPGVAVLLEEHVEDNALLVDRPPQPMLDPTHRNAHFVQVPAGTPASPPAGAVPR